MTAPVLGRGPSTNRMAVVFCADPHYFQHLAAAAASVVVNAGGLPVEVHLLTCDRNIAAEGQLRSSLARSGAASLVVHHMAAEALGGLYVDGFLTKEAYLRILAPDVLPTDLDRMLYLDCDVVAVDDLRPLWTLDLGGKVLGAAPDYPRLPAFMAPERRALLGLPLEATYINTGVLLVDLRRWRELDFTSRLLNYARRMGDALIFHDQDAINAVLHDDIRVLDPRWNLQARMYRVGRRAWPIDFAATIEARRKPAVIHYTGSEKPWKFRVRTPRKRDYRRALQASGWPNATPPLAGPGQRLEYALDLQLSRWDIDYLQVLHLARRLPAKLGAVARAKLSALRPIRRASPVKSQWEQG